MTNATQGKRGEACKGEPTVANGWHWGRELLGPPTLPASDDFEARVERAWAHMKGAFFAAEEHQWLREVLMRVIKADCGQR
jgi:hypothetical protein